MASTIKLKNGSGAPTSGQLVQGEPALDLTNKRLYTEDSGGAVIEVGTNPTSVTTGAITADTISLGDYTDALTLGASNDLSLYHDGTNSQIKSDTGSLILRTDAFRVLNNANSEQILHGDANGAVTAYYDNTARLATTSTGIDVTGTVTADGLTVSKASGDIATLEGTGTTADVQANLVFNPVYDVNARIVSAREGAALTSRLSFETGTASDFATTERLRIAGNGDISFYEDTGTTAKFFWDASAEALGIGASPSTHTLEVWRSGGDHLLLGRSGVGTYELGVSTDNALTFEDGGTERMRIDSAGNVGIGTSSPSTKLSVTAGSGNGISLSATSDTDLNGIYFSDTTGLAGRLEYSHADNYMRVFTNGSEAMRIDSSGNVGIGTSAPSYPLTIGTAGTSADTSMLIASSTTTTGNLFFGDATTGTGSYSGFVQYDHNTDSMRLGTNATERMRIDSSGNLLVGTTTAGAPITATTGGSFSYRVGNEFSISRQGTGASAPVAILNQTGDDGQVLDFRKDGTTVGSIGSVSGDTYIVTGDTGLRFWDAVDEIIPVQANGAVRDAAISLGDPSYRFKDVYLSGGVYLGGTGSANLLDDYEEGTFTSAITPETSGTITLNSSFDLVSYTKVGQLVHVAGALKVTSVSSPVGNYIQINVPFTTAGLAELSSRGSASVTFVDVSGSTYTASAVTFNASQSYVKVHMDASTIQANDEFYLGITYPAA